jgi:3-oxoacyl-[acyl-carrier protein] reductase
MISIGQSLADEFPEVNVITLAPGRTATRLRRALAPLEDQRTIQQPEDVAAEVAALLAQADAQPLRSFVGSPLVVAKATA